MLFLLVSSAAASWTLGPSGRLGEPLGPRLVGAHSAFDATLTTATARSRCVSPLLAAAGETSFDYLVIGGGSGGISAARHAAAHGAKVAVIKRGRLGGTCVNVGCVPKKVMFNAASVKETINQASGYGFSVSDTSFDMGAIKAKRDACVTRLNGIYKSNLANSEVTFIEGDARFTGPKSVTVGDSTYTGKHVLVAVGGKPTLPNIPGAHIGITSDGFFDLEEVPKKVAVIGSGYIAVELAGILNVLGSSVDLFIRGERPLRIAISRVGRGQHARHRDGSRGDQHHPWRGGSAE